MDWLTDAWDDVWSFLERHEYLEFLVIVAAAYLAARLVDWVLSGSLRQLARRSETRFDDRLIEILHRPVMATVLLAGLIIATHRLEFSETIEDTTVLAITTVLIVVWVVFGLRFTRLVLGAMKRNHERFEWVQDSTQPLLANVAAVVFFLVAAYAILLVWDINITGLVASAGIVGLALSFAAQDTLSNLFAGIAILSDRPYEIGDFIILDSGERGKVTRIGLRSTSLLTRDDVEVSIPNSIMGASKIVNEAGGPPARYRIRLGVGVAYGSDVHLVLDVLNRAAAHHDLVLTHPEARARFREFGDYSLTFELLCWIARPADRGLVLHDLHIDIYRMFAEENITIPFPQRDLHIKELPVANDDTPAGHE